MNLRGDKALPSGTEWTEEDMEGENGQMRGEPRCERRIWMKEARMERGLTFDGGVVFVDEVALNELNR